MTDGIGNGDVVIGTGDACRDKTDSGARMPPRRNRGARSRFSVSSRLSVSGETLRGLGVGFWYQPLPDGST